jgi:hypothetical protein
MVLNLANNVEIPGLGHGNPSISQPEFGNREVANAALDQRTDLSSRLGILTLRFRS